LPRIMELSEGKKLGKVLKYEGRVRELYSPKIVDIIKKEEEENSKWRSCYKAAEELGCSEKKFLQILEELEFRKFYPELFKKDKKDEHYSEIILEKLKKDFPNSLRKRKGNAEPIMGKYLDIFGPPISTGNQNGPFPMSDDIVYPDPKINRDYFSDTD